MQSLQSRASTQKKLLGGGAGPVSSPAKALCTAPCGVNSRPQPQQLLPEAIAMCSSRGRARESFVRTCSLTRRAEDAGNGVVTSDGKDGTCEGRRDISSVCLTWLFVGHSIINDHSIRLQVQPLTLRMQHPSPRHCSLGPPCVWVCPVKAGWLRIP